MEGSLVAYKVFTNGSVLPASDVNTYLMDQSVMVFSSSATRAAALTAPVEGMLTWLQDVNRYEYYSGAGAWTTLGEAPGLSFISNTSFSAVASHSVSDVFSSTYKNYKILMNVTSATSSGANVSFRLRVSGADNSTSAYTTGGSYVGAFNVEGGTFVGSATATSAHFANVNTTLGTTSDITMFAPFATEATKFTSASAGYRFFSVGGGFTSTTSFTGFTLLASAGNITGSVSVFGLRDS
jgi:hypothetical protein